MSGKKDKLKQNKSPLQLLTIILGKFGLDSSACRISDSHEIGFMGWVGAVCAQKKYKTKSTSVGNLQLKGVSTDYWGHCNAVKVQK